MDNPLEKVVQAVTPQRSALDRAYRLHADEYVPDGIRRIARGQLLNAHDALSGTSARKVGEAVHEARKRLKRVRASVRLARDAIGEQTYDRENAVLRQTGRRLAAGRDAQVLLQTLDGLTERFADELAPHATGELRARLQDERDHALTATHHDDDGIATVIGALDDAIARTPTWTFECDGFDALAPGLRRIYRRGRKRMRAARKDRTPENLHEWRKRVKDLWHATQIVRVAQPERLKLVRGRAHDLADLLGDANDLHMLRDYVETHPHCFADATSKRALLAVIDRRSEALRDKALKRGRRLYKRKPKRFVGAIERGWSEHASDHPPPLAG